MISASAPMLELVIILMLALAGYLDASRWWTLLGAALITIAGWWRKMHLLRQHPQVPFSSKMTTYLVVSIAINLILAWASYLGGRALSWLLPLLAGAA